MSGENSETRMYETSESKGCPVQKDTGKGRNQPIQAKRYVPKNVKPKSIQKPAESDMDEFSYTEIAECPVYETYLDRLGKWFGPFNVIPWLNALETVMDNIKKIRKLQESVPGAPCIRTNLGCDCVVLTGNTAVHWFLTQNLESLDRDPKHRLGPFQAVPYYFGKSIPSFLATEKEGHSKTRKFFMSILEKRWPDFEDAIEKTFTYRLDQMIQGFAKDPKFVTLDAAASYLSGYFVTEWLLGAEPPCNLVMTEFGKRCIGKPSADNFIGEILGQLFVDILWTVQGAYKRLDDLIKTTRSSRYYKQYENMAKEAGIEMKDFDRNLTYSIGLPSGLGLALPFASVIASLGENLGSVSELRKELGMDNLTVESVQNVEKYPLLDSLTWEVYRAYIRGQLAPRRAQKDLLMPGGNGKAYRIRKGDLLIAYYPIAMRDPQFFDNPERFNPRRFLDNPELKKHTFPFGCPTEHDPKEAIWACPARSLGWGEGLLKVFIGKWLQRVDWQTVEPPYFNKDAIGEYRPFDMPFAKLQYRQAYLDSLN